MSKLSNQKAQNQTSSFGSSSNNIDLAPMIDHTLLKPDASHEQIKKLCQEAMEYKFATVCVNSSNVGLAAQLLKGSNVKPIAVVGFPLGASTASAKAFETLEAIREGALEIDTVINIGALKSRNYREVYVDIRAVVEAAGNIPVKVILETSQLNEEEKIIACTLSKAAAAAFVKTSTGFGGGGATVEDIKLMRRVVGKEMGVKASGGIKTREDALKMVEAGANRLGTSSSIAIVTGQSSDTKGY
ncbi:MAG: deoxyribose-phosphate aldolase [Oligoflexia bacterium]|nr:deoxyribose-phosphate aldolase [Oligoflexia bacterium]